MSKFDFDLFVIGAGSGGVRLARMSASMGARVAVAEDRDLGGTCVNVGCVPKKLFVYASHVQEELEDGAGFGWSSSGELSLNWAQLVTNKNREIERLNGIYEGLLTNSGTQIISGRARLVDAHTVDVNGKNYSAE
ncbi:FAD-dependent oxidoreductase, partial [Oleiphilus sp. HI0079]|uniref:FAD-dependent oxidoreductase n=2 Tax=Oleiphilus TaxID=141450 RepID=UPI000B18FE19